MLLQDISRYKTQNFRSTVTDENIHMDVRFGNGQTKQEGIFDCGMNCFLIFAHIYVRVLRKVRR